MLQMVSLVAKVARRGPVNPEELGSAVKQVGSACVCGGGSETTKASEIQNRCFMPKPCLRWKVTVLIKIQDHKARVPSSAPKHPSQQLPLSAIVFVILQTELHNYFL